MTDDSKEGADSEYLQHEINRMILVLEEMGIWEQFCARYAERFPLFKKLEPTTPAEPTK